MTKISQLPADSNPSTTDYVPSLDIETNGTRKVTMANLIALFFNNIPDGSVKPADLVSGLGTDWTGQSWTPSLTNITVGNGTQVAKFTQVGKLVFVVYYLLFGSTTSFSGTPTVSLPVTADANMYTNVGTNNTYIGQARMSDASASVRYNGNVRIASTTTMDFAAQNIQNTYLASINASATVPMTWTTSDYLLATAVYLAA